MAITKFQVYGLDETYPELGQFHFKIVLSPRSCKSGQDFEVKLIDSDRLQMKYSLEKWGRKLNVAFVIDRNVADGVATAIIFRNGSEVGRLTFWVIKP